MHIGRLLVDCLRQSSKSLFSIFIPSRVLRPDSLLMKKELMEAVKSSITWGIRAHYYCWWSIDVTGDSVSGAHGPGVPAAVVWEKILKVDTWPPMTSQEKSMWLFPELWKCFWAAGGIRSGLLFSSLQYLLSQKASANRFCSSVTQVSVDHRFKSDIRTWKKRANDLTHEQIVTPKQINPAKNKLILIELGPTDT